MARISCLYLTEKPDMARNLAAGIELWTRGASKPENMRTMMRDGHIRMSDGQAISFLFGHMLEMAPPDAYLSKEQSSGDPFAYLPFTLDESTMIKWPKAERDAKGKVKQGRDGKPAEAPQLRNLVSLLKSAGKIVNAGDTDREGQLIMDELLQYAGVDPRAGHVYRLALESPKKEDIAKLLEKGLESNAAEKWVRRYKAAVTRELCDWNLGMTGSRAYRKVTGFSRMSVGRVQTPTLNIVVQREIEIENFKPVQYYVPVITLEDGTKMRWFRREGCEGQPGFDREGRIVDENVAKEIARRVSSGMPGQFTRADAQKRHEAPPLPFDLSLLQSTAVKRYGMSLKSAGAAIKALYERHKVISYVGTDCRYLPESMLDDAPKVIQGISRSFHKVAAGANMDIRTAAWNDSKLDEHHAIIPTGSLATGLTDDENKVFNLVSRRYMAQFYPNHEFMSLNLQASFSGDEFKVTEKVVTRMGWKEAEYDAEDPDASEAMAEDESMQDDEAQRHQE